MHKSVVLINEALASIIHAITNSTSVDLSIGFEVSFRLDLSAMGLTSKKAYDRGGSLTLRFPFHQAKRRFTSLKTPDHAPFVYIKRGVKSTDYNTGFTYDYTADIGVI